MIGFITATKYNTDVFFFLLGYKCFLDWSSGWA